MVKVGSYGKLGMAMPTRSSICWISPRSPIAVRSVHASNHILIQATTLNLDKQARDGEMAPGLDLLLPIIFEA